MRTPLNPPPPYWSVLPFQSGGRFNWNRIGGAFGSTGAISPSSRQWSGRASVFFTRIALSILAPLVGSAMRDASMRRPFIAEQLESRPSAESIAPGPAAQPARLAASANAGIE